MAATQWPNNPENSSLPPSLLRRLKAEILSKQPNSNFRKHLSGIPISLFSKLYNKQRRHFPRSRNTRPRMRNHRALQSLSPLFDEILGILGTENVIADRTPSGFSSSGEIYLQIRSGEARVGPADGLQGICLNSEQRIEQEEENLLVLEGPPVDAVDVSPMVHKITELVRGENGSTSMEERLGDAGLEYDDEIVEKVLKRCFKVPRLALRFFAWVKSNTPTQKFQSPQTIYNLKLHSPI